MRSLSLTVALAALPLLLPALAPAGEKREPDKAAERPEAAATVLRMSGTVEYRSARAEAFQALAVETSLAVNDQVRTGKRSVVELRLADESRLTLGAESSLVIRAVRTRLKPDETLLDLEGGALGAAVDKPLAGRQRFEISTPVAVCGVRGTRLALVHENPAGGPRAGNRGRSTLTVGTGLVHVRCLNPLLAGDPGMNVGRNQYIWVTWDGFGKPRPVAVLKGQLQKLMGALPGWVPDPADPRLLGPVIPAELGGKPGRPGKPGAAGPGALSDMLPGMAAAPAGDPGAAAGSGAGGGTGAYGAGAGGFHRAAGMAILGNMGLGRGLPLNSMLGGDGGGGDAGDGADADDPVNTVPVRPGQPIAGPRFN